MSGTPKAVEWALEDDAKLALLRAALVEGAAALDRGDFTEVEEDELDTWLDRLDVAKSD